ncbi:MAG: hypothetical protein V8R50_02600 [Clostridia bacterium]
MWQSLRDWDDAMDFDIDLPDGNAAAEMAADDITSADDIASMEIELPDLESLYRAGYFGREHRRDSTCRSAKELWQGHWQEWEKIYSGRIGSADQRIDR